MGRELLAEPPCGHPFQAVHEPRQLDGGREVDEEVDVVFFPVQLSELAPEAGADVRHHFPTAIDHLCSEGSTAVLRHEHQMGMASRHSMPT